MTSPEVPEEEVPQDQQVVVPPVDPLGDAHDEDESAVVPVLLTIYALYLLLRGGHDRIGIGWRQVAEKLNIQDTAGRQFAAIAQRAVAQAAEQAGNAGAELWMTSDAGIRAGVQAGVRAVAEALLWHDRASEGPVSRDAGGDVPTMSDPPATLAGIVVTAVVNAAVVATAAVAGWESKTWRTMRDSRVRHAHREMEGQQRPMAEAFTAPDGSKLRFPGDPTAPVSLTAGCRCRVSVSRR